MVWLVVVLFGLVSAGCVVRYDEQSRPTGVATSAAGPIVIPTLPATISYVSTPVPTTDKAHTIAAPSNLRATPLDSGAIRLEWRDNSDSESEFMVYRNGLQAVAVRANLTTIEDSMYPLQPGRRYCYVVEAWNGNGASRSNQACANTVRTPVPPTPTPTPVRSAESQLDSILAIPRKHLEKLGLVPITSGVDIFYNLAHQYGGTVLFDNYWELPRGTAGHIREVRDYRYLFASADIANRFLRNASAGLVQEAKKAGFTSKDLSNQIDLGDATQVTLSTKDQNQVYSAHFASAGTVGIVIIAGDQGLTQWQTFRILSLATDQVAPRAAATPTAAAEGSDAKLFPVSLEGGKWGYIDNRGKAVIEPRFDFAGEFSEGLALVQVGRQLGYIDKAGRYVVEPRFYNGGYFSEGLAWVSIGGKVGYIDKTGQFAIKPQFDGGVGFSDGLTPVQTGGKYGYIDKTGRFVIQPQFDDARAFSEGLAAVGYGDVATGAVQYGYIDKTGRIVINPQFELTWSFTGGLAQVQSKMGSGYIDKTGRFVWRNR
jgi:hypothetical protein